MSVDTINHTLAILTLLAIFAVIAFCISLALYKRAENPALQFLSRYGLLLGFLVSLGGTLTSLYYSNIVGYAPCVLCWYQRIFLYPQVLILGIALYKRDPAVRNYSLALAGVGGLIGLYQVLLEHGLAPEGVCGATGVSCTTRYVYEYGFISIPMMSLMAFILVIISVYSYRKASR